MLPNQLPPIEIIKSNTRLHYRNRIQLHYNLNHSKIGFMDKNAKEILAVPHCKIMNTNLFATYQNLLETWQNEIKKHGYPPTGHVEIYDFEGQIEISWNLAYAAKGFSQVNQETNLLMVNTIHQYYKTRSNKILDLFAGAGNLTNELSKEAQLNRICVDLYPNKNENKNFFDLNLFKENALELFLKQCSMHFDTLFIDPPRSGFKELSIWVNHYKPQYIAYVSCHPATMIRDLKPIMQNYLIKKNHLIDLFPGTYHYEAMIFLEKRPAD